MTGRKHKSLFVSANMVILLKKTVLSNPIPCFAEWSVKASRKHMYKAGGKLSTSTVIS